MQAIPLGLTPAGGAQARKEQPHALALRKGAGKDELKLVFGARSWASW